MVVYKIHGFRWVRAKLPMSILVYVVRNNIDDAAAEYIQEPTTTRVLLESFQEKFPDIMAHLPELHLLEQYDPEDLSDAAVSQPYAFVADRVEILPDDARPKDGLHAPIDPPPDVTISQEVVDALARLRDVIGEPEEKIGWWLVYNGDPVRFHSDDEEGYDSEGGESRSVTSEEPSPEPTTIQTLRRKISSWFVGEQ
ncbi:hypothetical protein VTN49DRAFT_6849 [Thermomyces lanuginosus]|uniref:uncharacterized protein n=1 Tax=Thermomyces lanuginosus TaxID=5541 RepID=UPI00374428B4